MVARAFGSAFSAEEVEDVYANAWASTLAALRGREDVDERRRAALLPAHRGRQPRLQGDAAPLAASRPARSRTRTPRCSPTATSPRPTSARPARRPARQARDVLASLPPRRRAVMLLRYGWGLEPKEVCRLIDGLSPRAYRKEITRGVEQMIDRFRQLESGEWCATREPLLRDYVAGIADDGRAPPGGRAHLPLPALQRARRPAQRRPARARRRRRGLDGAGRRARRAAAMALRRSPRRAAVCSGVRHLLPWGGDAASGRPAAGGRGAQRRRAAPGAAGAGLLAKLGRARRGRATSRSPASALGAIGGACVAGGADRSAGRRPARARRRARVARHRSDRRPAGRGGDCGPRRGRCRRGGGRARRCASTAAERATARTRRRTGELRRERSGPPSAPRDATATAPLDAATDSAGAPAGLAGADRARRAAGVRAAGGGDGDSPRRRPRRGRATAARAPVTSPASSVPERPSPGRVEDRRPVDSPGAGDGAVMAARRPSRSAWRRCSWAAAAAMVATRRRAGPNRPARPSSRRPGPAASSVPAAPELVLRGVGAVRARRRGAAVAAAPRARSPPPILFRRRHELLGPDPLRATLAGAEVIPQRYDLELRSPRYDGVREELSFDARIVAGRAGAAAGELRRGDADDRFIACPASTLTRHGASSATRARPTGQRGRAARRRPDRVRVGGLGLATARSDSATAPSVARAAAGRLLRGGGLARRLRARLGDRARCPPAPSRSSFRARHRPPRAPNQRPDRIAAMARSLEGKVFFITGAARGIGAAVAAEAALARRPDRAHRTRAGAARSPSPAALGPGHLHIDCDVTDTDSVAGRRRDDRRRARRHRHGPRQRRHRHLRLGRADAAGGLRPDRRHQRQRRPPDVHLTLPHLIAQPRLGRHPRLDRLLRAARRIGSLQRLEGRRRALQPRAARRGRLARSLRDLDPSLLDRHGAGPRGGRRPEELRRDAQRLPWPVRRDDLGRALREGDRRRRRARRDRIFIPPSARLVFWLRNLINQPPRRGVLEREAPELVPQMDAEVAALGRTMSARTSEINELERDAVAPDQLT